MATIPELMLRTAKVLERVRLGVATDGSTTTLVDTALTEPANYYDGGTLWLLTGDNAGACITITGYGSQTAIFDALSTAIAAGDEYALATAKFPKWHLEAAVKTVLQETYVPTSDDMVVTAGVGTLPTGAYDIKQVHFSNRPNYRWVERAGSIYFDDTAKAGDAVVWFNVPAIQLMDINGNLPNTIDLDYIKWAAAVRLWRGLIETVHKDDVMAVDLLNEAKTNELYARSQARSHSIALIERSPRYALWGMKNG